MLLVPVVLVSPLQLPSAASSPDVSTSRTSVGGGCTVADEPFRPASLRIPGVVRRSRVLALGRDARGTPRTPPLTDRGKWQLGWDRKSRIRPGSARGVVRLVAHTYPWSGPHGLALGNRLLTDLHTNALLVVEGRAGQRMCYRVTGVRRVGAAASVPAYYASTGRPRLAILVCSGVRRGPGDWSHRTIWFAEPASR